MKCSDSHLFTPIYLKLTGAMPWPDEEKAFYLLNRDGLFLCRNTRFFRSCVPVADFPSELAGQRPFLELNYPRIPRRLIEQAVGFFDVIGERYGSEAAVLIAWNRETDSIELIVPDQIGWVIESWSGNHYPMELEYEVPPLPPHLVLLGDIHSHVDGAAYASSLDKSDEAHRPGLHLVVGRILDEPPQFHCEATADGVRFRVRDLGLVLEGYHRRRVDEVPEDWIRKVTMKPWGSAKHGYTRDKVSGANSWGGGSYWGTGTYQHTVRGCPDELEARGLTSSADGNPASLPAAPVERPAVTDGATGGATDSAAADETHFSPPPVDPVGEPPPV